MLMDIMTWDTPSTQKIMDAKNENSKSNIQYRKVGYWGLKRILSKLRKHGTVVESTEYLDMYRDKDGKYVFYIRDEVLSKALYKSLENRDVFQTLPKELDEIGFISVEKQERIYFVTCNSTRVIGEDTYIQYVLSAFYNSVLWVSNNLSTDDTKIYINLNSFFSNLIDYRNEFLPSLLLSISLEKYELDHEKLTGIIDKLLYFCSTHTRINFYRVKEDVSSGFVPFYSNIRRGIYFQDLDQYGYNKLPVYLYVNIFKLASNENCFENLNDFFDNSKIEEAEANLESEEFIFDEAAFVATVKQVSENDNFITYKKEDNSVAELKNSSDFLKIKNNDEIAVIKDTLRTLEASALINNYSFLYSLQSNDCYIMYCTNGDPKITLTEYINKIGNNDMQMSKLISLINDTFISSTEVRRKLFIDKNMSLLEYMYITKDGSSLSFDNISNIYFKESDTCIEFRYPLVIMQLIKQFLDNNRISVGDIYKCRFMKLFSAAFAKDIIDYLKTQDYTSRGMLKKLKDTLAEEYATKIEFLENIPLSGEEAIKITFLSGIKLNDTMKNILDCQKTADMINGKCLNASYVSLEDQVSSVLLNRAVYLSTSSINKLFYNFKLKNSNSVLIPEKLIVSKDFANDENYQIVGIVWNHSKLYSIAQLIKDKVINTPQIYKIVASILYWQDVYGYSIGNRGASFSELLVDDDFNVIFNCTKLNNISDIFVRSRKKLEVYHRYVVETIINEFGADLVDFKYFSYGEIFNGCASSKNLSLYHERINNMKFCDEHKEWYLNRKMCTECQKIYIVGYSMRNNQYNDSVANFYLDGSYTLCMPKYQCKKDMIQLGIKNGLYEKFGVLAPRKIVFDQYSDCLNGRMAGVACDYYDFLNVLELNSFNMIQRLKVVLLLYKKLLPSILDGTFIVSSESIFNTMFMDKNLKGEIIIPNLSLLRCDRILSTDENAKRRYIEETKNMFARFLHTYITSDSNLSSELREGNVHLLQVIYDIDHSNFDEKCIRKYLSTKDGYCKVHDLHYSSAEGICPKCIENGISKDVVTIYDNEYFKNLKENSPDYEGGEANLYSYGNDQVQKIFNSDVDLEFKSKIIGKALQKAEQIEQFNREHDDVKIITISRVLYSYENNVLQLKGYAEDFIDGSFKISALKDKEFVAKNGYERKDIVEILIKACEGIQFIHSIGGFIGDLNGGNILIKDKVVYIIDIDGMSFDEVRNFVYTDMYIYPPSVESKNITAADDWYSFAIQAFYYLTYSHPFRGVCDKAKVPVNEIERMKLGYSVLGNHGIKVPNISIGWDFMPKYMVNFFIETFEGKKRQNMSIVLMKFLQHIMSNELKFEEIIRSRDVCVSVSEYSYVDTDYNWIYKEEIKFPIKADSSIKTCGDNFLVVLEDCTYVFNDNTGQYYRFNKAYSTELHYAIDNRIYYISDDQRTILVDELNLITNEISTHSITKATTNPIIDFIVSENNKFVMIEDNETDDTIDIYCNMINIASIDKDSLSDEEVTTSILYDKIFGRWIVLYHGDKTTGIIIDKKRRDSYYEVEFPETMLGSKCFYGNSLYYLEDGKICYYNVNSQKLREKVCKEVRANSRIQREANKFVIHNENKSFMYVKS